MSRLAIGWTARTVPLAPDLVLAETAPVAVALLRRALEYPDDVLTQWAGIAAPTGTVALLSLHPDAPALPWVDGVRYLGRAPDARTLYLPTALAPNVPAALLYRALRLHFGVVPEPLAVWPDGKNGLTLLSLHDARALDRTVMASWK